jgi:hypothetical protein
VDEDGTVHGLKNVRRLDDQDVFTHFRQPSPEFTQFLLNHWDQAYSAMFVYHIQPLNPALSCSIIHVAHAGNGKGTQRTVHQLTRLPGILWTQFNFTVAGVAFDGDSCFNKLHDGFKSYWRGLMASNLSSIPLNLSSYATHSIS